MGEAYDPSVSLRLTAPFTQGSRCVSRSAGLPPKGLFDSWVQGWAGTQSGAVTWVSPRPEISRDQV